MANTAEENLGVLAHLLQLAGSQIELMSEEKQISERFKGMMVAQLNSVLYTCAFAVPSGVVKIQLDDTNEVRVTRTIEKGKK